MFTWNIAKSAEAMFSRWAIKRVCKFLLKKKLGKYILGDIDLNQLDVQLRAGTIQLSDLAINVDYINQKIGSAGVIVKEGSVGSLTVTMPWKEGGCRIEVDELEVVLTPQRVKFSRDENETCTPNKTNNSTSNHVFRKLENEMANNGATTSAVDVHEGVKTIAKMVKWLLTSFHVKVKKLIVAFDPLLENENRTRLDRTLVLRISEVECGTHISDDPSSNSFATAHNFLGLSRLTNFVKFEGAVLELLHMEGLDHYQDSLPEIKETPPGDWFSGYCSSGAMTTIIAGEKGGFSGNLKLSIPWTNGSLDIRKVDADLHIEPLELRLQPSTIRCFISMWDLFKGISDESEDNSHRGPLNSSFVSSSSVLNSDKGVVCNDSYLVEKIPVNTLLSESHLISDWVTGSQKDINEEEPDFGASVDQFFECFDGLRNSQSALGNSVMWNWTCSVFSAITAASNLASGSLHVPSEQQHVETNFNATIAKASLHFSFIDEDQKHSSQMMGDKSSTDFHIHRLCTQLMNLNLVFQVRPHEMNFEVTVHHIQLVDHLGATSSKSEIASIQQLQAGVQNSLRTFHTDSSADISLTGKSNGVNLLKTSGPSQCHVNINSGSSDSSFAGPTSISLKLPPFVFWVNFDLISMALDFAKEMTNCIERTSVKTKVSLLSPNQGKISRPKKRLEGNVVLPNARIILCFPSKEHKDYSSYQFVAFDFISPTIESKNARSRSAAAGAACSLHLHLGEFYLFSITSNPTEEKNFSAENIIKTDHSSLIGMFWQSGPSTGRWIAKKAKLLASSGTVWIDNKLGGKQSCEFASVTTVKDVINSDTRIRQEILSTSEFFVHLQLPPVTMNLSESQFENVCGLLNQTLANFSSQEDSENSALQTSILLECRSIMIKLQLIDSSWASLTLQVDKFELLSVSNIGGIRGSDFLWVVHGPGNLWGSIIASGVNVNKEFLLLSCSDSITGRGDGEGSNVLSSGFSGSNIVNFSDSESNRNFTSITIRSATIIAIEGRLDWFNSIISFFSPPACDDSERKNSGSSLNLNFIDVGLSYEPHFEKPEPYIACFLSASSLKVSNTTLGEYKIRLQDFGFLICPISSESHLLGSIYSAENLSKFGYVKVAQEAHVEAILRMGENGHSWELVCTESHVMLNTCHDTTLGLITLAGQLQKVFTPDMQEYAAHLESRWNSNKAQNVHENYDDTPSVGEVSLSEVGNLMDKVCEDAFQLDGNPDSQAKFFECHVQAQSAELIEEYFLSDLHPHTLSEKSQSPDDEERIGNNGGWYPDASLRILENHASRVNKQTSVRKLLEVSTSDSKNDDDDDDVKAKGCVLLKNINVTWRMYGGFDWSNSRDTSICYELALSGIGLDYYVYPDGEIRASSLSLTIHDVCLNDRSDHAPWKLVLGYYPSKKRPRKSSSRAVKLNLEAVKPDPSIPLEENRLRIALLPLRLHLHQSQLDFFTSFFGGKSLPGDPSTSTPMGCEEAFLTYFQKFDLWPSLIRVDYSPCHVDLTALRGGKYVELVNLVPWKGVELQLKHVQGLGLYGWNSVGETILGEWLEDISQNQIHKLLKGLPPIKSLMAVGSGAAKLVSLPVKNYKKDHRLIKGMQRGTIAFLRSISLEAIGLGVHLAAGAHDILLQAEYILTTIPPSVTGDNSSVAINVRENQPNNAQQGIQQACQSLSDGLGKSASALVQTPLKRYQRGDGVASALATAAQAAPGAAIAPASAAARAVHCALLGFRNSLDPERKRESLEKYLGRTPPNESMQ